jgi:NAD(P)H-hydrate epimerase
MPELIVHPFDPPSLWEKERGRADAFLVGPGLTSDFAVLQARIQAISAPVVVDAGALHPQLKYPPQSILTPHEGELKALLQTDTQHETELWERAQHFVNERQVYVVLKGAVTKFFRPHAATCFVALGDPGMATAGSGDVLAGVIGALLAQGLDSEKGALLGIVIHSLAGKQAAQRRSSYSLIASDIIEALPAAMRQLITIASTYTIR